MKETNEYVECIKAHDGSNFTKGKQYKRKLHDEYYFGVTDDAGIKHKLYCMNDGSGKSCIGSVIFIDVDMLTMQH